GLFSASLVAFIIESHKTLSLDQGALMIQVLAQILDSRSNTSALSTFHPTSASLVCKTVWFLGLGISLSCAIMATLVEQWARDFIQETEIRPPIIRARLFSYLYFGV
ncbi:hypothetical protein DFH09DRAFT_900288, partial [Mycena vulgaris]